ncbi:DUF2167 domain-containing protein [Paucibacter sp. APW11]|uniref:DUF2167 domain-containing protein n=1 Tax=Roseateles aquae TaxID=3077235 RepID=A0ABU3PCZ7_9BURK|nr:DUF2167 domain-containing protein [Paucibacter sp. APW11]MDT8999998.1 DUF2167 domain-containing protein [Paucibacter sp. APW11]
MTIIYRAALACALALGLALAAHDSRADDKPAAASEAQQAFEQARQAGTTGPADVPLAQQAVLHLPAGKVFIPQPHAAKLMRVMGNPGDYSDLLGLVFPQGEGDWFATLRFEPAGYIKDDDAREWNADDLLKSFREGTEASNEERVKLGVPALEIVGWAEKPAYAADTHRLVWAMASRHKRDAADAEQGVNYNTYALGREGYLSLNLVTGLKELPQDKPQAAELLAALEFNEGKRYGDFNSATDHVAEYGLAALVLGVGAKKLGLLAVVFAFVAKFAKIIIIALLAFGGTLIKLFKRKPSAETAPIAAAPAALAPVLETAAPPAGATQDKPQP